MFNKDNISMCEIQPIYKEQKNIICNGEKVNIEWDNVATFEDEDGLKLEKGYKVYNKPRKIIQFICHHDATLSSKKCYEILKKRGLSVHFMIDNNGKIYQLVDTNHMCWHAKGFNDFSLGVEISNAVEMKYQNYYVKNGFGERPIISKQKLHKGTFPQHLGFYPIQLEALKSLIKFVCNHYNIPIVCPLDKNGNVPTTVIDDPKNFNGILGHFHNTLRKSDPISLNFKKLIEEINK